MNNAKYLGMHGTSGRALTDINHIRQSVTDILLTPQGSRPMRRAYGSLLSELMAQPQSEALRLQIMAACYSAILAWEPRITLTGITFNTTYDGKMVVDITGTRIDTPGALALSISVSQS